MCIPHLSFLCSLDIESELSQSKANGTTFLPIEIPHASMPNFSERTPTEQRKVPSEGDWIELRSVRVSMEHGYIKVGLVPFEVL